MCGIAGVVGGNLARERREEYVRAMLDALEHRGPDDRSMISEGMGTIGVVRLSIVDRAGGRQPMAAGSGVNRKIIAYNGEVYNFLELRDGFEARGFRFATRSDTETVLAAHSLEENRAAVRMLDGMFAYGLWEPHARRLLLVRDPLGIKPLYYFAWEGSLAFASEPKALRRLPVVRPDLDPSALLEYFLHGAAFAAGYVTSGRSFFQGIEALRAGEMIIWRDGGIRKARHWSPVEDLGDPPSTRREAVEIVRSAVQASIRRMHVGEVPIGTALSGGIDSSLITAETVRALESPVISASITYVPDGMDPDAQHARMLSEWLNRLRHGSHRLSWTYLAEDAYLDRIDDMIRAFDEPHWEIRQLAMFENYRTLKREGVTVALTGEGADELFFGYHRNFPGFRSPEMNQPAQFAEAWRARLPWVRALLGPAFRSGMLSDEDADGLIGDSMRAHLLPCWEATGDRLRSIQCWYLGTFLHWLLMVNDRCSMAQGMEGRFPYLSRQLVREALRLPPDWNVDESRPAGEKLLLREAAADLLPMGIWRDRAKAPLPVPQSAAYHLRVAESLRGEIRSAPEIVWERYLDKEHVVRMIGEFEAAARVVLSAGGDASATLSAYVPLDSPLQVRTPHLFAILTFLRWHSLCLS